MNHAGGQCHGSILINESSPKKESGSGGSNVEGWKAEKGANIISVIMRQAVIQPLGITRMSQMSK